jgi:DNA-binding transcriptional ArsR family regulator
MSTLFSALQAPRRREILRLVWTDERSAGDIHRALGDVTFGAVSQHLKLLETARLVSSRREGRHRFYKARREELGSLERWLESTWSSALQRLQLRAEVEAGRRGPKPSQHGPRKPRNPRTPRKPSRRKPE